MRTIVKKFLAIVALMSVGLTAQAGHLFTQAALNTPIMLTGGFGITIPQLGFEGSSAQADLYLCDFDSGDIMRITIGTFTQDFNFDALPAGWSYFPPGGICDADVENVGNLGGPNFPGLENQNLVVPFNWRIDAVAGSFTIAGFRLNTLNGKIDGTNAGTVNQDQVTQSGQPIPVFGPIQMVLLALGLIGVAGIRHRLKRKS